MELLNQGFIPNDAQALCVEVEPPIHQVVPLSLTLKHSSSQSQCWIMRDLQVAVMQMLRRERLFSLFAHDLYHSRRSNSLGAMKDNFAFHTPAEQIRRRVSVYH